LVKKIKLRLTLTNMIIAFDIYIFKKLQKILYITKNVINVLTHTRTRAQREREREREE